MFAYPGRRSTAVAVPLCPGLICSGLSGRAIATKLMPLPETTMGDTSVQQQGAMRQATITTITMAFGQNHVRAGSQKARLLHNDLSLQT